MSITSERLKIAMQLRNMKQVDLAQSTGIGKSSISTYLSGGYLPKQSHMQKIAEVLSVNVDWLYGKDVPMTVEKKSYREKNAPIRIPVLGSIPAGIPIEAIEDILDWEELPASMGKGGAEYFALQVKGDSMFPNYLDGDVLIFRKQETCNSGQDCAVMVNGDDATFKRVKIGEKGITLQPLNPAYDPMYFTREECAEIPVRIIGVVVELRRKI